MIIHIGNIKKEWLLLLYILCFLPSLVVAAFFLFAMGGSFFFIESKTFAFSVEEGGSYFLLRIFERGLSLMRSVFMGKASANRFLFHLEKLISKRSPGLSARTIREGDLVFILQLGSNAQGTFLMVSKLHGRRKGSIVIPKGRMGNGWRGFGLNLRNILKPPSLTSQGSFPRIQSAPKADEVVVVGRPHNHGGAANKGKEKIPVFQNLKSSTPRNPYRDHGSSFSGKDTAQLGANILSNIDVIAKRDLLTLEISLRMEHGKKGQWAVVSSFIKDVGSNQNSHGPTLSKGRNKHTQN